MIAGTERGRLVGRVALITGAGSGIGEAIARRYADEGATVYVTGIRADNTGAVADSIRAGGGRAHSRILDVADSVAVAAVVREVVTASGHLDILVANAALAGTRAYAGPLLDVTDEVWDRIIAVNLSGVFYCAREAARVMVPRKRGCIITIGSVNSYVAEADVPAYAASKGGVLMLTKSLARDLGPHGIRVNGIAPGATDTPKMREAISRLALAPEELVARIPLGRRADAAEVAAVAAFLASDDASYVHGEMIVVDGGMLCT